MSNNHPNAPDDRAPKQNGAPQPQQPLAPTLALEPRRRAYLAETYKLTPDQVDVVRNAICVGATDHELEFFLATCRRVDLDPFARQIWFVKRRQKTEDAWGNEQWVDVGRPETGIDGYRTIAERTGEYGGQGPLEWCGEDGKWTQVWLSKEPPRAARAMIYRKSWTTPIVNVALYDEFCPKYKNDKVPAMWRKMPANQLAKCAEAGGFRRAFPRDLSGLVTDTEMEHVDAGANYSAPPIATKPAAQLETKKADRAAEIVDAKSAERPELVDAAPATAKKSPDAQDVVDDLDLECHRLLKIVTSAQTRDDLQDVGRMITEAKKRRASGVADDAHANMMIDTVEPMLQKQWRALDPKKKAKAEK